MAVFEPEAEGIVFDAEDTGGDIVGRSPWALAGRRLFEAKDQGELIGRVMNMPIPPLAELVKIVLSK